MSRVHNLLFKSCGASVTIRADQKSAGKLLLPIFAFIYLQMASVFSIAVETEASTSSGPKIEFLETSYDIGLRLYDKEIAHDFPFKNIGTQPLTVRVTKTSCSCTVPALSSQVFQPGEMGTVTLRYVPKLEQERLGQQSFTAMLATNDPRQSQLTIQMTSRLSKYVDIDPDTLDFGTVAAHGESVLNFTVRCFKDDTTPSIKSVTVSSPLLTVKQTGAEEDENGALYRYSLSLDTTRLTEALEAKLTLQSTSSKMPIVETKVKAGLMTPMQARPSTLLFGLVKPGSTTTKKVELKMTGAGKVPEPATVYCADSQVVGSVERDTNTDSWTLTAALSVTEDALTLKKIETVLEVRGSNSELLSLIPVRGVIDPGKRSDEK